MGLCPSNSISEEITGKKPFSNVAGMGKEEPYGVDQLLISELKNAGVEWFCGEKRYGEPQSSVVGVLRGWVFRRAWYYWSASGPNIPLRIAMPLHAAHGKSVRVEGHCGCPSPDEYCGAVGVGSYHVDNADGLKALADTLRAMEG